MKNMVQSLIKIFQANLIVSKTNAGFTALGIQNFLKLAKRKQFFTPRERNPEIVLLTSRICLKYLYQ